MVDDLTEAARSVGLEVNANKTNWMSTNSTGQTLMVNGVELGLMRSRMTPMATKRKSWHVCVLPAFLYGSEAWALTKSSETKLVRCQRRMERHMLCHRLVDRVPNATIRDRTKLKDVIQEARKEEVEICEEDCGR
uniref:Reverse transcriptase domain-containing protein n=1 Tax=Bursaphelenchus xylophilus TaxID=6326 RepID=A0A1I7SHJ9_BURXY